MSGLLEEEEEELNFLMCIGLAEGAHLSQDN
jgi:hypothetical protein